MKNKIKSLLIVSSPIIVVSSVLGTIYAIKAQSTTPNQDASGKDIVIDEGNNHEIGTSRFDPTLKYKKEEIFPKLRVEDLYEYIKLENEIPVLDKQIVARVIKIIVTGLGVTFGELNFEWQFKTKQNLLINSYWYEKKGDIKNGFNYIFLQSYSIKIK